MRSCLVILLLCTTGCLSFHSQRMPDAPADATFLRLQQTEIHYLETGDPTKPAVVLLHGFASSLNAWHRVQPALSKTHRVVSIDLKGFGLSGRPPGDYSPQEQAKLVLGVMDSLGIERASIVGHSWGSSVALSVALAAPDRVDKVALYDAWVYEQQIPTFFRWSRAKPIGEMLFAMFYKERPEEKMERAFYDRDRIDYTYTEAVRKSLARPGTSAAALEAVRGQRFEQIEDRYGEISHETLLMWGREDAVSALSVGVQLSRQLPNAELVVFEKCGHFPMEEAYAPSTNRLQKFLGAPP